MHRTTNVVPDMKSSKKYDWQKGHQENKTGSRDAYKPTQDKKR